MSVGTLLLLSSQTSADLTYTVTDLGTLEGSAFARAINDNGVVAGDSRTTVENRAQFRAFEAQGGTIKDLGALPNGVFTLGKGINNSGMIVGHGDTLDSTGGTRHAFIYDGNGLNDIHTLGEQLGTRRVSFAFDINNANAVVGYSQTNLSATDTSQGYRYENGAMSLLESLSGPNGYSRAWSINDAGQVAGESGSLTNEKAVRWDADGEIELIGTLAGGDRSYARSINSSGDVVGYSEFQDSGSDVHAFGFINDSLVDFGTLGGDESYAYGINDDGLVVGVAEKADGSTVAFLHNGIEMLDLNDLIGQGTGWELGGATAINSSGQIVGYGRLNGTGATKAFLLTPEPVPEPAAWIIALLFCLGLGTRALWLSKHRRQKHRAA